MKIINNWYRDLKLYAFPLLLILIYQFLLIYIYKHVNDLNFLYKYFIISSGISFIAAGIISDILSRKTVLVISFIFGILCFSFLFFGFNKIAVFLLPLFFSVIVARAAIIDNHKNISIKKLMAISYIMVFLPWSFFSEINLSSNLYIIISCLIILTIISLFTFKDHRDVIKRHEISKVVNQKNKKQKIIFLLISLFFAQVIFFLIVERIGSANTNLKLFDFLGMLSLAGTLLSLFVSGRHYTLLKVNYGFIVLSVIATFAIYFLWDASNYWEISLAQIGIFGGFYLPIVTEQLANTFGKKHRGLACGLVEFQIILASCSSLFVHEILEDKHELFFLFLLLICSLLVYTFHILQKGDKHYSPAKKTGS